jgi:hypothetical protein
MILLGKKDTVNKNIGDSINGDWASGYWGVGGYGGGY